MPSLPGYALKLGRADEHLDALDDASKKWFDTNPYGIADQIDPRTRIHYVRATKNAEPSPTFGLLIGDTLHNLRSGLDQLTYSLAVKNRGIPLPPTVERNSEFPIFDSRKGFQTGRVRRIGEIHPEAQARIQSLQPYRMWGDETKHPLWLLYELSNLDKHRRMALAASGQMDMGMGIYSGHITHMVFKGSVRLKRSAVLMEYRLGPNIPANIQLNLSPQIVFGEDVPLVGDTPVSQALRKTRDYIHAEVLPRLEPYL